MQPASATGGGADRLQSVDVVRGFALLALFLVHVMESYELYWSSPTGGLAVTTVFLLFLGKSFSLLALCFGFSFFILMDRAAARGHDFSARFAWRLLVLEAIGLAHAVIYRGDIIQLLAALGFVLLLAHRIRSNRAVLVLAVFCLIGPTLFVQIGAAAAGMAWANARPHHVVDPAMQAYLHGGFGDYLRANLSTGQVPKWWFMIESGRLVQILGLYLTGMLLGRIGFFARLEAFRRARTVALVAAIALTVLLYYGRDPAYFWLRRQGMGDMAGWYFAMLLNSWFDLAGTATWLLLLLALFQGPARRLLMPLAAVGRATLTFYILQSVVFVPIFYGFGLGLYDDWSEGTRLAVGLGAAAGQVLLAAAWFRRFRYGPIEWAWRAATFGRTDIPFLQQRGGASGPAAA